MWTIINLFELKSSHCLTLDYKLIKTRTILLGKPQIPQILSILFLLPVCSRRGYQLPLPADDNHTFVILLLCCTCLTLFWTSLLWLTCPYYMGLCVVYKTFTHLQLWSLIHKSCQVFLSLEKKDNSGGFRAGVRRRKPLLNSESYKNL